MPAGGNYTIASADMSAWTTVVQIFYYTMAAYNPTITASSLSTQKIMTTLTFSDISLTNAQEDQILADLVTSLGISGGRSVCTVNLAGASNAALDAAGLASRSTLLAAGWTVTHN
jgi:hypothetical protein